MENYPQAAADNSATFISDVSENEFSLKEPVDFAEHRKMESESKQICKFGEKNFVEDFKFFEYESVDEEKTLRQTFLKPELTKSIKEEEVPIEPFEFDKINSRRTDFSKQDGQSDKFHWKPAIVESLYFLGIQHGFRMLQKRTYGELDGKFFKDWGKSVRNLSGWRDNDSSFVNYVAHPMQGAVTGRIFINNSDKAKKLEFSKSKEYWDSRLKAMAWSAAWSTQFELGPFSEATIGNVGLYDKVGPNRLGWVDLVVTPTAGTGLLIGEDIIDKYILKKWLEKGTSRGKVRLLRMFITPIQSFTNVLGGKLPWKRYSRR